MSKHETFPAEEIENSKYRAQYIEELFKLYPDDVMLARMWEMDPETMHRLMPEIGNETEEEIVAETPGWRGYAHLALNSLRITLGRESRLTPRQRMREARLQLDADSTAEPAISQAQDRYWKGDAMSEDSETYFKVAWYGARRIVEAEQKDRRRRALRS